jgi:hypothetical protein
MKKYLMKPKQIYICIWIFGLISSCDLSTPDYVGTWVDKSTVSGTTITVELEADEFTLTIDTENPTPPTPHRRVVTGTLTVKGNTMAATITGIIEDGKKLDDALLQAIFALIGGDTHNATYSIVGDTMILSGQLLIQLTGQTLLTLTRS